MRRSVVSVLVSLALLAGFFSIAITIQHKKLEKVALNPPFLETWQLAGRSGDVLKVMALRYDLLAADFLWLRAIQSFGGRGMTNRDWKPLYNMFDTITELDPMFEEAYTFGNMVIGDEGGKQREALELIDKGMFHMPEHYRVPFEGMYVANWTLNDVDLARWYGRIAVKRRNAPDWVPRIVAYLDVASGAFYVGLDSFIANLMLALHAEDPVLEGIALGKCKETIDKWNRDIMTKALVQYTTSTGKLPSRIEDLVNQPALQDYEVGKMSRIIAVGQYYLQQMGRDGFYQHNMANTALPGPEDYAALQKANLPPAAGKTFKDLQNDVFKFTVGRQSGIPQEPNGTAYRLNLMSLGNPNATPEDVITNELDLKQALESVLAAVREQISKRKEELGRYPSSLRETFYTDFKTTEPYGGTWKYDPSNGDFRSSTHPTL